MRGRRSRDGSRAGLLEGPASQGPGARRARQPQPVAHGGRDSGIGGGGRAAAPRGERRREPRVLWVWWHGGGEPDLGLLWRSYVRRFDLEHTFRFLKQTLGWTTPRVRHPEQADRWSWGWWWPPTRSSGWPARPPARGGSAAAVGGPLRRGAPDTDPGPSRRLGAFGSPGHARRPAETLREIARTAQRAPLGPGQASSGPQKERLSPRRPRTRTFCDGHKAHRKTPVLKTQAKADSRKLRKPRKRAGRSEGPPAR